MRLQRTIRFVVKRLPQWISAVRSEARSASVWSLAVKMGWTAMKRLWHPLATPWTAKMRACRRCMIYDRVGKKCLMENPRLGCGCYTPFLALFADRCWADDHMPEERCGWGSVGSPKTGRNPLASPAPNSAA
jgi:hypothetical protein